jgi:hypothetical protein
MSSKKPTDAKFGVPPASAGFIIEVLFSTLKKEVVCPSVTSVRLLTTWRCNVEDVTLPYIHNYVVKNGEMGGTCSSH